MKSWRLRVLAFKAIGATPFGRVAMDSLRHHLASHGQYDFNRRSYIYEDFKPLLSGELIPLEDSSIIEIGSGWHPLLPIVLHGLGAGRVVMTDVSRHMRPEYVCQTIDYVKGDGLQWLQGLPIDHDQFRLRINALAGAPGDCFDRLRDAGIEYLSPFDFSDTDFSDGEFDCVISNSCLGYIPTPILPSIFKESARILRQDGVFVSNIHVYDDFCREGSGITPANFLQFSESEWDRIGNSSIHHQNRLRPRAYVSLASDEGFAIEREDRVFKGLPDFSPSDVPLHADFRDLPEDEIRCRNLFLVARKPAAITSHSCH
ncbi:MAG: hypothetical protein CMJ32_04005 [Phycisphaerae bacterium]|nr:hypothetical protein [Phycisphaerae bacterium]